MADSVSREGEIRGTSDVDESPSTGVLRRILAALILLSIVGLLVELVLLEHYDSPRQWTPLVVLAVALVSTMVAAATPGPRALRVFRVVMALCIVTGIVGLWLHYRGNVEFELERDATLGGIRLFWESIRGATPALAPGAMVQLGLLGLAYTHRHPALHRTTTVRGFADTNSGERS